MNLLLLADHMVGKEILKYLLDNFPEDLSLVVTTEKNEIFCLCESIGLPVCVFGSSEDLFLKLSNNYDLDLGVLAWWPSILKEPLLSKPRNGFINTHPSLLPNNRGKHYNFWTIVEESPYGVTLHHVDSGIDTGDIIAQKEINYDWTDTGESLYFVAQKTIIELFCQTYPTLRTGNYNRTPQNTSIGSYHHSSELEKASKIQLDSFYRGRELLNLLRARTFEGYPGCWFEDNGSKYEISINIRKVN